MTGFGAKPEIALDSDLSVSRGAPVMDGHEGIRANEPALGRDLTGKGMSFPVGLCHRLMVRWKRVDQPKMDVPVGLEAWKVGIVWSSGRNIAKPGLDGNISLVPVLGEVRRAQDLLDSEHVAGMVGRLISVDRERLAGFVSDRLS